MGFQVQERSFEFSEFPGRFATPLMGAAGAIVVGLAGRWGAAGMRIAPLVAVVIGLIAMTMAGRWLKNRGVLATPVLRRRGVNLQATRSVDGRQPSVWLCAHLDTKSQPIPTLIRSAGIVVEGIGLLMTAALSIAAVFGTSAHALVWVGAGAVTLVGALPVVSSVVGTSSPGALDNASGVATVLAAARQLPDQPLLGVLLTDGEELGLAGSRSWARETRAASTAVVLNCDGVDDIGEIQVMFSGRRPAAVLEAVARASTATGVSHHARRLAVGILTDSVAFGDAGTPSVTFSRGSLRSLARVHTRRDDLAHLRGVGIADTARLIAAAARQLSLATAPLP